MLVGRLVLSKEELGRLRSQSAEFVRYMIRARVKVDPEFMNVADYEIWELDGLRVDDWEIERLLQMALQTIIGINEKYLERCGSGGMSLEATDPLQELKELVGFFVDYNQTLREAIRSAITKKPIDWPNLARWDDLPAIRSELDKLPRLDDHVQVDADGVDPQHGVIRWKGRMETCGPKIIELAEFLWHSESVPKEEVIAAIWPARTGDVQISTYLNRLNEALMKLVVPWQYRLQGRCVVKDSYSR